MFAAMGGVMKDLDEGLKYMQATARILSTRKPTLDEVIESLNMAYQTGKVDGMNHAIEMYGNSIGPAKK